MIDGYVDPDTNEWRDKSRGYLTKEEYNIWCKKIRQKNLVGFIIVSLIVLLFVGILYKIDSKIDTDRHLAADGGTVVDKYTGRYNIRHIVIYKDNHYYTFETSDTEYYSYGVGDEYCYD